MSSFPADTSSPSCILFCVRDQGRAQGGSTKIDERKQLPDKSPSCRRGILNLRRLIESTAACDASILKTQHLEGFEVNVRRISDRSAVLAVEDLALIDRSIVKSIHQLLIVKGSDRKIVTLHTGWRHCTSACQCFAFVLKISGLTMHHVYLGIHMKGRSGR